MRRELAQQLTGDPLDIAMNSGINSLPNNLRNARFHKAVVFDAGEASVVYCHVDENSIGKPVEELKKKVEGKGKYWKIVDLHSRDYTIYEIDDNLTRLHGTAEGGFNHSIDQFGEHKPH